VRASESPCRLANINQVNSGGTQITTRFGLRLTSIFRRALSSRFLHLLEVSRLQLLSTGESFGLQNATTARRLRPSEFDVRHRFVSAGSTNCPSRPIASWRVGTRSHHASADRQSSDTLNLYQPGRDSHGASGCDRPVQVTGNPAQWFANTAVSFPLVY